jgi:preprotein translocase subunit SecA
MLDFLSKILGNPNERKVNKIMPIVDMINDFERDLEKLSDDDLRRKTAEFRQQLDNRDRWEDKDKDRKNEQEMLENLLPEAFAVVREGGKRILNMRHFDVQMVGGIFLHRGGIAEMRTGEGKTLVATLPAYLNALTGKGVHVVTVNDYLAERDAEWMGQLYRFLGLSVGTVLSNQRGADLFERKKEAYAADITYGTNNEFGFDYLRDNMATSKQQLVQRPFNFAIIDEVDSILIDEARTPLIISGKLEQSAETYHNMARIAPQLKKDEDYTVDEKTRNVIMTEEGIDRAQGLLDIEDLFDPVNNLAHYLLCALKAKEVYLKDIHYVVKNNEVVIVDEFTGRLMEGRRWSDGIHQSVEAKEGVRIQDETQTLASITYQNLFRLYPTLSGMTGTAMTEEAEFGKIYSLGVTAIPTNRSDVRHDQADVVYKNERVKFLKVIEEIVDYHQQGRPVLVGTVSIEKSELISTLLSTPVHLTQHLIEKAERLHKDLSEAKELASVAEKVYPLLKNPEAKDLGEFERVLSELKNKHDDLADRLESVFKTRKTVEAIRNGIEHRVLNAKHHEKEALIVAQAGRYKAVTIATNMAGRGTDILLGGNPELMTKSFFADQDINWRTMPDDEYQAKLQEFRTITEDEKQKVVSAGGLHIIGTERHESRRIDNQLRGRAARQGDPGSTKFYLSLEDPLMRLFGGQKIAGMMEMMNVDETLPITNVLVTRAIEGAQRKVEAYHFDIRKSILQYDDVLTEQRQLIYDQRRRVLEGYDLIDTIERMIGREIDRVVTAHLSAEGGWEDWDPEAVNDMFAQLHMEMPQLAHLDAETVKNKAKSAPEVIKYLTQEAQEAYERFDKSIVEEASAFKNRLKKDLETQTGQDFNDAQISQMAEDLLQSLAQNMQTHLSLSLSEDTHPLRGLERMILLSVVDSKWIDYLHNLDNLRDGIGLRAYGQKDPLIEYKREAFEMFQNMSYDIERETLGLLFRQEAHIHAMLNTQFDIKMEAAPSEFAGEGFENAEFEHEGLENNHDEQFETPFTHMLEHADYHHFDIEAGLTEEEHETALVGGGSISKNDDCPCGSGKKYNKCHGA